MATSKKIPAGQFNMLYFASAMSFTKKTSEHLPAPLELIKLFDTLEAKYPGIKQKVLDSCAVTVNMNYIDVKGDNDDEFQNASSTRMIQEGDEVAIIPPVSSG
ncbi:hypothetical protein MMC06_000111 [Schaereria dolodes]|nr:hypothetical protein [Schaereria dolodes]